MEGENRVSLLGKPDDGGERTTLRIRSLYIYILNLAEYVITMPNMYARGILFGKMVLELGDVCIAKNEKHNMFCDLEFKTKGFFSGTYNAIAGRVRRNSTDIGEVSGRWSHVMEFRDVRVGLILCVRSWATRNFQIRRAGNGCSLTPLRMGRTLSQNGSLQKMSRSRMNQEGKLFAASSISNSIFLFISLDYGHI